MRPTVSRVACCVRFPRATASARQRDGVPEATRARRHSERLPLCVALMAAAVMAAAGAVGVSARTFEVSTAAGAGAAALAAASAGDTLLFAPGVHAEHLRVTTPVVLRGAGIAILDGGGRGTVVEILASDTRVEHLTVRRSGDRLVTVDSGIKILAASNVHIRELREEAVRYGIYAERANGLRVTDSVLRGNVQPGDELGAGNGVHLWYCDGATVERVTATRFLDAVYLSFVQHALVAHCTLYENGRYGLHTMYCQENQLQHDLFTRNVAGCALMFSNHLEVRQCDFLDNRGPRTYGMLLRDCSDGEFVGNRLIDNTIGFFLDGSNRNWMHDNLLQENGWGILLWSSCAGNRVVRNNFIGNDYPLALDMRYSDNAFSDAHDGNYWTENEPFDLDANGVGDAPFGPVTAFAYLSKEFPDLSLLAKSPAVAALGVAERVFPALRPSEIVDSLPRVQPAPLGALFTGEAAGSGAHIAAGHSAHARPAWGAALAFAACGALGLWGVWQRGVSAREGQR